MERQEHAGGTPEVAQTDAHQYERVEWFDYDEIDRRNGWTEPGEDGMNDDGYKQAGEAFASIMEWIGGARSRRSSKVRAAVVEYMVRPDSSGGSQTELAKSLGVSKQHINALCIDFRDRFNFRNAMTRSDRARSAMRKSYVRRGIEA